MLRIESILETSLYVADLERSRNFYGDVLGLEVVEVGERLCAMRLADRQILLLCLKGASATLMPGGHDGDGRFHLALAVPLSDLAEWEAQLRKHGVAIEEKHTWESGGQSLYFRDPDQHLIELATPGTWSIY